jgi:hypothetical protein
MADDAFKVEQNEEQVDAQVAQPRDPDADKVEVNEVSVATDRVITDPAADDAVQIPEEGRGNPSTPLHSFVDAEHVEETLSAEAGEQSTPSDEDREQAAAEGRPAAEVAAENS